MSRIDDRLAEQRVRGRVVVERNCPIGRRLGIANPFRRLAGRPVVAGQPGERPVPARLQGAGGAQVQPASHRGGDAFLDGLLGQGVPEAVAAVADLEEQRRRERLGQGVAAGRFRQPGDPREKLLVGGQREHRRGLHQ